MKTKKPSCPDSPPAARRRIFIVDDHPITRFGLTQLINRESDLVVCGEAEDAQQAFSAIRAPLPDLVVADVGMPGQSVIEFIKNLKVLHPRVPVLILSTHDEAIYAERMIRAGARGYIMKSEGGMNLLQAIRQLLQGRPYLSPAMSAKAFEGFGGARPRGGDSALNQLTDREFEVFQLFGEGKTGREVAKLLCLSPKTVVTHRLNLCRKLNIKTLSELIRYAVEHKHSTTQPR